jgi:hypothetical protein
VQCFPYLHRLVYVAVSCHIDNIGVGGKEPWVNEPEALSAVFHRSGLLQNVYSPEGRFSQITRHIEVVARIIAERSDKSRRFISQEVCRTWDWRQANGVLKDMVCRSLLLLLESKGFIKLPPRKCTPANPLANRKKPVRVVIDQASIKCSVGDLFPIKLEQVRRTGFEKIFNGLVSEHHYLGYTQPVFPWPSDCLPGMGFSTMVHWRKRSFHWLVQADKRKETSSACQ